MPEGQDWAVQLQMLGSGNVWDSDSETWVQGLALHLNDVLSARASMLPVSMLQGNLGFELRVSGSKSVVFRRFRICSLGFGANGLGVLGLG